jgi:DNA-binding response OmpR family regulator
MKILIIEDEPELLASLVRSLEKEHYLVETAYDFESAREKIGVYDYSCILLDIGLPDDKLAGLDLGADDYLTKPFHLAELHSRIKAVMRRKAFDGQNQVQLSNLCIDFHERSVSVGGVPLTLNRKEYDILSYFAENKNRLISRGALAEHVWGDHSDAADSLEFIYSQIKNLRKKLKDHQAGIEIQAVYGMGYKLIVP